MSRDDDDFGAMGGSRSDKPKGGGGLSTGAIIGIVVGALLLCTCLGCGGCCALNWDEFKKNFDKEFKKAQEQQQQKK
jgi:hypothetical protein